MFRQGALGAGCVDAAQRFTGGNLRRGNSTHRAPPARRAASTPMGEPRMPSRSSHKSNSLTVSAAHEIGIFLSRHDLEISFAEEEAILIPGPDPRRVLRLHASEVWQV